jgi:hypothetical protein
MKSAEVETLELARAVELLGRSSRHGRLLAYLGEKYFQKQGEQLTEFILATEFFGRSPKRFDAGRDAVVRVEVHRLRKKLREIYEKGGSPHGLRISLPAGSYVPEFECIAPPAPHALDAAADAGNEKDGEAPTELITPRLRRRSVWRYVSLGIVGCAIAIAISTLRRPPDAVDFKPIVNEGLSVSPRSDGPAAEMHVMMGYSGSDVIDSSGVRWQSDRFFSGGGPWRRIGGIVARTSRAFLFANWRNGEFTYDVPLPPGTYELRLFFVSPLRAGDEKLSGFNIGLGGKPLLTAFDPNINAPGVDVADELVFRDVVPDADGFLHLKFSNQMGTPWLNALEVVPGTPGKLKPVRIIAQPNSYVDHKGQRWRADDYFLHGFRSTEIRSVSGTDDPELFSAERYGNFSYAIPVDARGRYTVVLHFVEFYFGPQLPGGGGVGSRIFNVSCNGRTLLEDFDVYKEGGNMRVVTKTFANIKPSPQGKINLTFEPVINNATISGIEILDESQ